MSTDTMLIAALMLAMPIVVKYLLAFQIHVLVEQLRTRDREVRALFSQLRAIEQEQEVVRRAAQQVSQQHQRARVRRGLLAERLEQLRGR